MKLVKVGEVHMFSDTHKKLLKAIDAANAAEGARATYEKTVGISQTVDFRGWTVENVVATLLDRHLDEFIKRMETYTAQQMAKAENAKERL